MIAIFYALKNEIEHFKRHLEIINEDKILKTKFVEAKMDETPILLVQTGMGNKNSKEAIKTALENFSINLIISTGFAGALKDKMEIGDIVYAKKILNAKNPIEFKDQNCVTDTKLQCVTDYTESIKNICSKTGLIHHYGDTITVDKVISTASKKNWLGNNSSAIAVDMETYPIAETASDKNIPFICVRSISDDVKTDLNLDIISNTSDNEEIDARKTGWNIMKNPQSVPHLMKLRKQTIIASRNIAKFLLYFMDTFKQQPQVV